MVIKQRAKEILEKVEEVTTSAKEDLEAIKSIYSLKALKTMYRKLSKKYHPDMGGDAEVFKEVNDIYNLRQRAIKDTLDITTEDDKDFIELVQMMEEMILMA